MKKIFFASLALAALLTGCNSNEWDVTSDLSVDKTDPTVGLTDPATNTYEDGSTMDKAPLYWSVYGNLRNQELADPSNNTERAFTWQDWDDAANYVKNNLKDHGYHLFVTDGFANMDGSDGCYMDYYSRDARDRGAARMAIKDIIARLKAVDPSFELGIYDSPFWVHYKPGSIIPGTESIKEGGIPVDSLRYDEKRDKSIVLHPEHNGEQFGWVMTNHRGAEQYFEGWFKHYADLGVHFVRMDFLSWYEDGMNYTDVIDKGYGRENYVRGMQWINKYAKKYHVYVSLVMPHMKNNAIIEKYAGNMVRIDADVLEGTWDRFSNRNRGILRGGWPNSENAFDGFINWSKITGRGKIRPDGDFIRISSFASDDEKRAAVSLPLMAGGPIAVTDLPNEHDTQFFANDELLALNQDGFVGQPLKRDLWGTDGEIWYGQMKDGTYVIGLFNRENALADRSIDLSQIGATGTYTAHELWGQQADADATGTLSASIPAHGCMIFKLIKK